MPSEKKDDSSPPPPYVLSSDQYGVRSNIQAPTIIIREEPRLETVPGRAMCPHCGVEVLTVINRVSGKFAYLSCIVLGLLTFCCCIPFCVDGFKDVEHKCPRCSNTIAIFERL